MPDPLDAPLIERVKNARKRAEPGLKTVYCAYCGEVSNREFSIPRDGDLEGPEVYLCHDCGCTSEPTLLEIWDRIANPDPLIFAMRELNKPTLVDESTEDPRCLILVP